MNKSEIFKNELSYIKDENIKKNAKTLLELVPDYFFSIPASSTGKYHPLFSQGEQGLVRHTKVALAIAEDILSLSYTNNEFTDREKDLLIVAILFHDSHKLGNPEEKYTRFDHPILAAEFIKNNKDKTTFDDNDINIIYQSIAAHMGEWNTSNYSNVTLPKPSNKYEFFVHMCDFLSSRKYLNVNFDTDNNISDKY